MDNFTNNIGIFKSADVQWIMNKYYVSWPIILLRNQPGKCIWNILENCDSIFRRSDSIEYLSAVMASEDISEIEEFKKNYEWKIADSFSPSLLRKAKFELENSLIRCVVTRNNFILTNIYDPTIGGNIWFPDCPKMDKSASQGWVKEKLELTQIGDFGYKKRILVKAF